VEQILSIIIFLPLLTALLFGLIPIPFIILRVGAILSSLVVFALAVLVAMDYDPNGGIQFIRLLPWIENYGISYFLGLDAISLVMLMLISFLMPLLYLYMWQENRKGYWYNMMLLQSGVTGAVLSLDLILFYMFWEMMLLPIFIMIGRYGSGNRQYNASKLLLMTVLGSMSMLFSILYLGYTHYELTGIWSYALTDLTSIDLDDTTMTLLSMGFLLAFIIKIPLIGFHTWMAPAYGSSPTPAVVILSSIMAKLGIYGLWRFGYGLFEDTLLRYADILITISLVGLIYYAIRAIKEDNLRRMFAFASASHLSLIAVGLFLTNIYAWGGSLYFIATHALSSAGMFLMIGLIYKRTKTIEIASLGGIASKAPKFAFFFVFFALSTAGLPSTGGFVSELLIIIGAFKNSMIYGIFTSTTMLMAMLYIFWMLQRVIFGSTSINTENFTDLSKREIIMLTPIMLLLLITGLAPSLFIPTIEPQLTVMLTWILDGTQQISTIGGL
jgi:NADH-quinone oxidoreductase subunit M